MTKYDSYFDIKWLVLAVISTATVILLTHLPQEVMPSRIQVSGLDKLQHVVAYGVITFLFIHSVKVSSTPFLFSLVFFIILVIGIIDEVTQSFVNRTSSFTDLVANVVGIATGLLFFVVGKHRFQKTGTE